MADVVFTKAAARAGTSVPLIWAKWTDSNGTVHYWSDRPIADSPEKTRRVIEWAPIEHALSDENGGFPAGHGTKLTVDDTDRAIRTLIATEATRYVLGQPVDVFVTSRTARTAGDTALNVFRGRWRHPQVKPGRLAEFTAEDFVTQLSDPAVMAKDTPKRRLAFGAQDKKSGFGEPIIYGDVNSSGMPSGGAINPIYIADATIGADLYRVLMVAGHACKAITEIYYNGTAVPDGAYYGAGNPLLAPGYTGWTAVNAGGESYIDYLGRRYTAILVRADALNPDDVHRVTCDVQGIETVGDGTGTLITSYFDAYLHFLKNFAFGNYQTGAWLGMPTWPDASDMIDAATFTAAQAVTATRMGDATGYIVRAVIGANGLLNPLSEWLARWNVSGDCRMYMWGGKYSVMVPNRAATISVTITEDDDLVASPPEFVADETEFATHFDFYSSPHFALHEVVDNDWQLASEPIKLTNYEVGVANTDYPGERRLQREYWMSAYPSALNAVTEWAWRHRHPVMHGTVELAMPGVHLRPGSYLNLTHREGATSPVTEAFIVDKLLIDAQRALTQLSLVRHETGSGATSSIADPATIDGGTFTALDTTLSAASGTGLPGAPFATPKPPDIRELGGRIDSGGVVSATAVAVPDRRRVRISATEIVGRTAAIARIEAKTDNAATSATPELWDVSDANPVNHVLYKAGSATTSTTAVEQTIDIATELAALVGTVVLELRVKGNNANNPVYAQGRLEITGG